MHTAVTRHPSDAWLAQQVREVTGFEAGSRFLICDNDDKYGLQFERAVAGAHIELLHTPLQAPRANAMCERFVGRVRRECLDHIVILSERHARRMVGEYIIFFNHSRPHQGIDQQIPEPLTKSPPPEDERHRVIGLPVLHGLQHDYRWVA